MRKLSVVLLLLFICSQTFNLQSVAFNSDSSDSTSLLLINGKDPVNEDLLDSQAFFEKASQAPRPSAAINAKVEVLLRKMTLEEKVGQMTQLEIGMICDGSNQDLRINPEKLEKAIVKYGVGSILNVSGEALTVDKWHEIIGQIQEAAKKTRLKIPVIYGIDSVHGLNYAQGSTLFPQNTGMAATWNPALMMRTSEITAMETRASAIPWNFAPVLDLGRQVIWPRYYETFGEDPYLAKVMGVASVRGYEGANVAAPNKVAACLKHYLGYSFPLSGKDRTPAWIPENYLREYFLPPFQAAVAAGARSVMVNSAEINGVPVHASKHILTDILRTELGFKGLVVSDWEDIKKMVTQHGVAASEKEATRMAIMAGIDMSMVPGSYSFSDHLMALVKEGAVPMTRIDEAVRRVLYLKFDLGLFEKPMPDASLKAKFGSVESRAVSLQAARESLTLLKNDKNILPLAKNTKVLVAGPTADSLSSLNNGWTYVWQGTNENLYPKDRATILAAIKAKVGSNNVNFVQGASLEKAENVAAATQAARDADVVVLCLGEGAYAETPGNIDDLTLPEAQLELAEAVAATGKPVVLVLAEGRPRVISRIADKMTAVLMAYNPSNEGGQAIADVLFGDFNPCGKLPFTYPRHPNALLAYDHKIWEDGATSFGYTAFKPQWNFGDGMSYTTFAYSDLRLDKKTVGLNGAINVSVKVTNTGNRPGKEAVLLYVRDVVASITPPGKRLKRFAKIYLEPGSSKTLSFTLKRDDFSFIAANNKPTVEPGDFEVMAGALKEKFTLLAK
ncbi:MAG: glycoside hydrolase family 3 N-terminal domain-containing protein [Acidobacteriota bacterium]